LIECRDGLLLLFLVGGFCSVFPFWLVLYRFDFCLE